MLRQKYIFLIDEFIYKGKKGFPKQAVHDIKK